MHGFYGGYALVGLVLLVGVSFVTVAFAANRMLRPTVPGGDKAVTYECGVDPVGEGWAQSHLRYYVFAYLYVVFAVDAIYLFPWATIFAAPGFGATTLVFGKRYKTPAHRGRFFPQAIINILPV